MTPTMELRFVERKSDLHHDYNPPILVLQQKWTGRDSYTGEQYSKWRDVPVEKETKV